MALYYIIAVLYFIYRKDEMGRWTPEHGRNRCWVGLLDIIVEQYITM